MADFEKVYQVDFKVESALRALDKILARLDRIEGKTRNAVNVSLKSPGVEASLAKIAQITDRATAAGVNLGKVMAEANRRAAAGSRQVERAIAGTDKALINTAASAHKVDDALLRVVSDGQKLRAAFDSAQRRIASGSRPAEAGVNLIAQAATRAAAAGVALDRLMSGANRRSATSARQVERAIDGTARAIQRTDEAARRGGVKSLEDRLRKMGVGAGIANQSLTSLFFRIQALIGVTRQIRDVTDEFINFDKAAVGASIRFDKSVAVGTDGYRAMRKEIRGMAVDAGISQAATAQSVMAWSKAGLSWDQTKAITPKTMEFAVAADLPDIGQAGNLLSDALGAFNLRSNDVKTLQDNITRVSDVVVKAADISTLDPLDIFEGYKAAAPMAVAMGESIEQLSADLVVLGNAGIKGSEAGTVIKGIFGGLVAARGPAKEVMKGLGVQVNDAQGNFRGLTAILADFDVATKDLGSGVRTGLLTKIVGKEHIAGFLDVMRAGSAEINKIAEGLNHAGGTAKSVADRMRDSVSRQFEDFRTKAVDLGLQVLEDTNFFGRLNAALGGLDFDKAGKAVTDTVIPALETAGDLIKILWGAVKETAAIINTAAVPAMWLAETALGGVADHGKTAADVLGILGALWVGYKVKLIAAKAIDVVAWFASIGKGALSAAAAQTALNTSVGGTTTALGAATKAASRLNAVFGLLSATVAGWTIGTVIYDEIIAPLIEAQDKVDKLRAGVEDSQTKDREIPVGKEKAIPILESDLVQAKKSLAEERKTHATVVADANARGVAMPEKGDREIQLEGYISQLENRIVVETQARQIEKYDVAGSENAYQTEDLGPNLAVSEYQEDWSPGSLAVAPTRIRPMPREDFEESSYLSEDMGIGEQSIPSGYRDPARLHTGRTKQIDEDTLFDLPVSRAPEDTGNYLQSLSEVAPAIETSTTVSQQVLATLTTMQKRLLNETTKGSYSGGTINQKIDIGGANIVINQASGSVNDLKKMLKLELAEHDRQVRADMSRAAKSISATEE